MGRDGSVGVCPLDSRGPALHLAAHPRPEVPADVLVHEPHLVVLAGAGPLGVEVAVHGHPLPLDASR